MFTFNKFSSRLMETATKHQSWKVFFFSCTDCTRQMNKHNTTTKDSIKLCPIVWNNHKLQIPIALIGMKAILWYIWSMQRRNSNSKIGSLPKYLMLEHISIKFIVCRDPGQTELRHSKTLPVRFSGLRESFKGMLAEWLGLIRNSSANFGQLPNWTGLT